MVASEQALLLPQAGSMVKELRGPLVEALTEDLPSLSQSSVVKAESAFLGQPGQGGAVSDDAEEIIELQADGGEENRVEALPAEAGPVKAGFFPQPEPPALTDRFAQLSATATTLVPAVPELPAYRVALPGWWLVAGSPGSDRLVGNKQDAELMFGFDGNDSLEAKGGDDWLYGGAGNDLLAGGQGDDFLQGEAGQDDLFGGAGRDRLDGGLGNDRIRGGAGDDWILLSGGSDDVVGGSGLDAFDARVKASESGSASSVSQGGAKGAVTLSYQVDFVKTRENNKRRVTFAPQASLALFFHEDFAGETDAETFVKGTTLSSAVQLLSQAESSAPLQNQSEDSSVPLSVPEPLLEAKKPEAQRLRSIELVMAPWGEANRIDFSLKKIKSAFAAFGDIQAPAIELNLAEQTLRYANPAVVSSKPRGKRRSKKGSANALLPQALSLPLTSAIASTESSAPSPIAQTLGGDDTVPVDYCPTELWSQTGAISPNGFTTVIVQGFQHATGSFGDDRLTGDEQTNIFFGGHGNDVLNGGAGHDLLISNEGDQMTGGTGGDCFRLNAAWRKKIRRGRTTPGEITPVLIQDFNGAEGDRIHLENDVFGTVALTAEKSLQYQPFAGLTEGELEPEQLLILAPGAAPDPTLVTDDIRLIYNGSSGELFYRGAEVLGGLESRLPVAVLAGAPQLQASSFLVV